MKKIFSGVNRFTFCSRTLDYLGLTDEDAERLREIRQQDHHPGRLSLEQERRLWKAANMVSMGFDSPERIQDLKTICEEVITDLNPALREGKNVG